MNQYAHQEKIETRIPLYEPGTVVHSKADPTIELAVMTYSQGVYYCAVIGNARKNNLPFFECQLEADSLHSRNLQSHD